MSYTYQPELIPTPLSLDEIRQTLDTIVTTGDIQLFGELHAEYGHQPVWVDDPTGHYPLRRHRLQDLRAIVGSTSLERLFFEDEPRDPHHRGRQFTVKPETLGAITRVLTEEAIE